MLINYDKNIKGVYVVNTTSNPLMLRSSPSTDGTVISEMPKSSKCICYGCYSGDWYVVTYEHSQILSTGFAHKNYLQEVYKL